MGMLEDALRAYAKFEDRSTDPATPASGQSLVYVKGGVIHSKDSAGTVVEYGPTGGGGGGVGPHTIVRYTGGDITVSSTTAGAALAGPASAPVAAVAGDVLQIGLSTRVTSPGAGDSLRMDVATIVSAAAVNYLSSAAASPASTGIAGWFGGVSVLSVMSGALLYVVQAGDISGGNVTVGLRAWVSAGSRGIVAQTASPLIFWVKNLRQ